MSSGIQDAARLQGIATAFYGGAIDRDTARSRVCDVLLERMGCSRTSLWKFDDNGPRMRLLCFASKERGGELDTRERYLDSDEFMPYLAQLIEGGTLAVNDAMTEPALAPMREHHLVPNHIVSTLDGAILLNGRAYGMVCCEETARRRAWRTVDVAAIRSIVSRLAALMTSYQDPALWSAPSVPLDSLPVA